MLGKNLPALVDITRLDLSNQETSKENVNPQDKSDTETDCTYTLQVNAQRQNLPARH